MAGKIILLNGASSVGKSTLAAGIQSALPEPFWHYSIDHLNQAGVLPEPRIRTGEFSWPDLREGFFLGFHRSIAAFASAGNNLVIEHILETREWTQRLRQILGPFDVFAVGLHCSPEELERRERQRGDRSAGDALRDMQVVHSFCRYDLEIDSEQGIAAQVRQVVDAWTRRLGASAFFS